MKTTRWLAIFSAAGLLGLCLPAAAQQSSTSLGEAARRVREQKKPEPKPSVVWTNDNIPSVSSAPVNVVGAAPETPAPAAEGAAAAPAASAKEAGTPPAATAPAEEKPAPDADKELEEKRAKTKAELADWKDRLKNAQTDLDILQREFNLARQQFYSNPGYSTDAAGKVNLDSLSSQVGAKQQEIEQIQQKIGELEDTLRMLNHELPPKQAALTPEQEREAWAARMESLREQVAQAEAEIARMREDAAARELTLYAATATGSMTSNLLQQLETRRAAGRNEIAQVEDDARRAGVPPGWVR